MSRVAVEHQVANSWWTEVRSAWQRFWFAPRLPHSMAVIRCGCGLMLAYIHLIWLSQLENFFGVHAWVDGPTSRYLHAMDASRSYLSYISSGWLLTAHELLAIAFSLLMAIGWRTAWVTPCAWFMTLMVCHRQTGALFGLDQVVMMMAMYLMICPAGAVASWDAWRRDRLHGVPAEVAPSVAINVATRLLQVHLCIIYLFGGLSKMRGDFWFEGSAMWWSLVNYEYQSWDIVWLGRWPLVIALLTHAVVFWETFYCALVWPRLTRPATLAVAVLVHGGIALFLGMPTFGLMMILANVAFIEPETTRRWGAWLAARLGWSGR